MARQVSVKGCIDPAEEIEPILALSRLVFAGKLIVKGRNEAIHEANAGIPDLELKCDGSKLDIMGKEPQQQRMARTQDYPRPEQGDI